MATKENMSEDEQHRIKQADYAWGAIRNSFITNKGVNVKLRIFLFGSLIGGILPYRLHIIPTGDNNLAKRKKLLLKMYKSNNRRELLRAWKQRKTLH